MKEKLSFSMLLFLLLLFLNSSVWAKYKIEERIVAVTIQIDQTEPKLEVTYSTKEITNEKVEVTILANEEIKNIEGWTLQKDKKTLKKVYQQNKTEKVIVEDLAKNITQVEIKVENIHEKASQ